MSSKSPPPPAHQEEEEEAQPHEEAPHVQLFQDGPSTPVVPPPRVATGNDTPVREVGPGSAAEQSPHVTAKTPATEHAPVPTIRTTGMGHKELLNTTITLRARAFYQVPVLADPGTEVVWDMQCLDGHTTMYAVSFYQTTLEPTMPQMMLLQEHVVQNGCHGACSITSHGSLVIHVDNRMNWWHERRVWIVLQARTPTVGHTATVGQGTVIHRALPTVPLQFLGLNRFAGAFRQHPDEVRWSQALRQFVADSFVGIDPRQVVDYNCHVLGCGTGGTGCAVAPRMLDPVHHPFNYLKSRAVMSACGIQSLQMHPDFDMVGRLAMLVQRCGVRVDAAGRLVYGPFGKVCLLAFDMVYDLDGHPLPDSSTIYVPNDYVYLLSQKFPDTFIPTCSVHPYRTDAVAELRRCAARGIRLVKWHPNSMHFDPAHVKCEAFYQTVAELHMIILTHTGYEHGISPPPPAQECGNPLRLRNGLNHGVKFIAETCATEGAALDLDAPDHPEVSMFDLWLRLMDDPRYEGQLWGDISAVISYKRVKSLHRLINRTDLHHRLVYGSGYPFPCFNVAVHTRKFVSENLLTSNQRRLVNELYYHNPLLFDLVLKRNLRTPEGNKFADCIFQEHPVLVPMFSEEISHTLLSAGHPAHTPLTG